MVAAAVTTAVMGDDFCVRHDSDDGMTATTVVAGHASDDGGDGTTGAIWWRLATIFAARRLMLCTNAMTAARSTATTV